MKFKGEVSGDYLRDEKVLRLTGKSTFWINARVDIPVDSPRDFMLFVGSCFQQKEPETLSTADAIPIRRLNMGIAWEADTHRAVAVIFEIWVGSTNLKFVAPVEHLGSDKIPEIERHFRALTELMSFGPSVARD